MFWNPEMKDPRNLRRLCSWCLDVSRRVRLCPSHFQSNYPNDAAICVVETVCVVVTMLTSGDFSWSWDLPAPQWEDSVFTWNRSIHHPLLWPWHLCLRESAQLMVDSRDRFVSCLYHSDKTTVDFWQYGHHWWHFNVFFKLLYRF